MQRGAQITPSTAADPSHLSVEVRRPGPSFSSYRKTLGWVIVHSDAANRRQSKALYFAVVPSFFPFISELVISDLAKRPPPKVYRMLEPRLTVLEYAAQVSNHLLTKTQIDHIEAIQRRALRIIYSYTNDMPYINALYLSLIHI